MSEETYTNELEETSGLETSTTNERNDESDKEQEEDVEYQSRKLRNSLEELFEVARMFREDSEDTDQSTSFEEQFIMLISQYSSDALQHAVLMTADDEDSQKPGFSPSSTGRLPIHLACDSNSPIGIIRWLLDADPNKQSILRPDKWGDLPIHTACSRKDVNIIKLLIDSDPKKQTLYVQDNYEYLPIHMACRYNAPPQVIEWLLKDDTNNTTLFEKGIHGQLPIHVACRCNAPADVVRVLLDNDEDKKSVLKEDNVGRLPIHVYLLRNSNIEVIKLLLEGMIFSRFHRVGLVMWKRDMLSLLKSLSTHERDWNTRDKLDAIEESLKDLLERAFLLELAIWKASCLADSSFKSMDEINQMASLSSSSSSNGETSSFDANQYKKERHIKSGAEVIIPGVLSFLEDEPINKVIYHLES